MFYIHISVSMLKMWFLLLILKESQCAAAPPAVLLVEVLIALSAYSEVEFWLASKQSDLSQKYSSKTL